MQRTTAQYQVVLYCCYSPMHLNSNWQINEFEVLDDRSIQVEQKDLLDHYYLQLDFPDPLMRNRRLLFGSSIKNSLGDSVIPNLEPSEHSLIYPNQC